MRNPCVPWATITGPWSWDWARAFAQAIRRTCWWSGRVKPMPVRLAQSSSAQDQGLVGQFNDVVADYAIKTLAALPGIPHVWAVGERVHARLTDAGLPPIGLFTVPNSVQAITPLVGEIQIESEAHRAEGEYAQLYIFHNRPQSGALYEPVSQRLLPLDAPWAKSLTQVQWPTKTLPEVMNGGTTRRCAHSSANIFSSRSFGPVPNPSPARMRAVWRRCSALTKTLMTCWSISTARSTVCARAASRGTIRRDLRLRGTDHKRAQRTALIPQTCQIDRPSACVPPILLCFLSHLRFRAQQIAQCHQPKHSANRLLASAEMIPTPGAL